MSEPFSWARTKGYECSSKGDKTYSALFALMEDGRSLEMHYQCDVKGYDPGGYNWRAGKGKPPLKESSFDDYLNLWKKWATVHVTYMRRLYEHAKRYDGVLSDCFAKTPINQAHALSVLLNDLVRTSGSPNWGYDREALVKEYAKPKLYNRHHGIAPSNSLYIGRGTPWGNPFPLDECKDRIDCFERFEKHVYQQEDMVHHVRRVLWGKNLVCSCQPDLCHGHLLLWIANSTPVDQRRFMCKTDYEHPSLIRIAAA